MNPTMAVHMLLAICCKLEMNEKQTECVAWYLRHFVNTVDVYSPASLQGRCMPVCALLKRSREVSGI